MNLGEILVANGASILLLIILLICRYMSGRNRRIADKVFSGIIFCAILGTFLETVTFLMDGKGGAFLRALNFAGNTILYGCSVTAAMFWVWYVDLTLYRDVKRLKRAHLPILISWAIMIALLLANIFGSFLFVLDEHNVYARRPLGYIFYVHLLGAYITSIILYYRFRRSHGKAQFFPIWMFITPLFLSIFIQIPFYGISVSYLGCTIGLIGLYMNIQSKMSLVDILTGLYNRAYIEHAIVRARRNRRFIYSGIMLDLDDFKQVNDSFGHSVGDSALIDAARLLMKSTDRDSEVFRYAGDEFILLVKAPAGSPDELLARTLATEKRIRDNSESFNSSKKASYKLVFSMGHAMLGTGISDDQFFRIMDEEMYRDKQKHKEQRI